MAEEPKQPVADPEKKETGDEKETKVSPLGEIRSKSFAQLARDDADAAARNGTPDEETGKVDDVDGDTARDVEKDKVVQEAAAAEEKKKFEEESRKQAEERQAIASKTAEEVVAKQREEERKAKDAAEAESKKKQLEEDLKPAWMKDPNRAKDKDGNPLPRSYDEIAEETERITRARVMAEIEERDRQKEAAQAKQQQETAALDEQRKKIADDFNKQLDAEIQTDLNDLYASNKLPKIVNKDDPNDAGVKAQRALFETGMKVNNERMAKGLPPLRSIKLVFYEHYKAAKPPAGHDAPVVGSGQAAPPVREEKYNFATDHRKSMRQVLEEEKNKALARLKLHS